DITERKQAEEALRESEGRYRLLFENMVEGFAYCQMIFENNLPDFKYLKVNSKFEELTRLKDVVGKKLTDVIPGIRESHPEVFEIYGRVALTGRPERLEIYLESLDSWLSISVYSPGKGFFVAVFDNITERKRAEQALRESEERYRDLVENSHELICTHDPDGLILSANRAAAENLGYDLIDFVGKRSIRDILAPEVRHQFDEYMARVRRDGATSGIMIVQTSSGERRMWEFYNSLRTDRVSTPIVRGMARDITEERRAQKALRQSEQRYRELFENSRDAIYVHDLKGRYTSFNRAAEQLSGYTRDEIIGKHFSNFVSPRSLKDVRENLCKKLDEEGETTYEVDLITKDRRRVPVEVSSRLIYENGEPVGVQGVARDITDRKRSQEALRTYSQRLIEAQEAERQVIARELHDEIGQVLTAVRMNLQSLQSTQTGNQLSPIEDSLTIVDEALDRVRELSLNLRPSVLDNLGLSSALRWYVDRYARRSGIVAHLTSNLEEGRRLRVELETACFRIVQEALTNVARHAQATRVSVHLKLTNGNLDLRVKDNGLGFEVEALLKNSPPTWALGLRGMEERAVAVLGQLKIDSAPKRGTEVRAVLPIEGR
ncbi:MAG: PAS domain S-box protein, partial [Acidobacteriota bacterium]